jgi:hypothetical protein
MNWQFGRQGTGYLKVLLLEGTWPLRFDSYLLRYPEGSSIPPHVDPIERGRHYRLNIVLKEPQRGGVFQCKKPIYTSRRVNLFRSDISEHSVTKILHGSRYVLSVGWVLDS